MIQVKSPIHVIHKMTYAIREWPIWPADNPCEQKWALRFKKWAIWFKDEPCELKDEPCDLKMSHVI